MDPAVLASKEETGCCKDPQSVGADADNVLLHTVSLAVS